MSHDLRIISHARMQAFFVTRFNGVNEGAVKLRKL